MAPLDGQCNGKCASELQTAQKNISLQKKLGTLTKRNKQSLDEKANYCNCISTTQLFQNVYLTSTTFILQ